MARRLKPDPRIPLKFRHTYAHLGGAISEALSLIDELAWLYEPARIKVLNETAPGFFIQYQELLVNHIVLLFTRMTAQRESGARKNRQQNVTLLGLLATLRASKYSKLEIALREKWPAIEKAVQPMQKYRHKKLAHSSSEVYLPPRMKIGEGITISAMRQLGKMIVDFLSAFDCFFSNVESTYHTGAVCGDFQELVRYLQLGYDAERSRPKSLRFGG
jgi:hypothetical protein